jgi:hypothetical protein
LERLIGRERSESEEAIFVKFSGQLTLRFEVVSVLTLKRRDRSIEREFKDNPKRRQESKKAGLVTRPFHFRHATTRYLADSAPIEKQKPG